MNIGIGIVALVDRLDLLQAVLTNIAHQTEQPTMVWIVVQDQMEPVDHRPRVRRLIEQVRGMPVVVRGNPKRSVSSARNLILRECATDVLMFMDDDGRMPPQAIERVRNAFDVDPAAAVLTFKTDWTGGDQRSGRYEDVPRRRRTIRPVTDVAAIEMAVSIPEVRRLDVKFDERFGPGGRFGTGEEFLFLADVLRAGGEVAYVPSVVSVHSSQTSGRRLDATMMAAKGAMFRRAFGTAGLAAGWLFVLRLIRRRELQCAPLTALRCIATGWREFGSTAAGT